LNVISEAGTQPGVLAVVRSVRQRQIAVLAISRFIASPLRSLANAVLVVSASEGDPAYAAVFFRTAFLHLLDVLLVRLCQRNGNLQENYRRIQACLASNNGWPLTACPARRPYNQRLIPSSLSDFKHNSGLWVGL